MRVKKGVEFNFPTSATRVCISRLLIGKRQQQKERKSASERKKRVDGAECCRDKEDRFLTRAVTPRYYVKRRPQLSPRRRRGTVVNNPARVRSVRTRQSAPGIQSKIASRVKFSSKVSDVNWRATVTPFDAQLEASQMIRGAARKRRAA